MRETPTNNIYNKKQYDQLLSNIDHNYQFISRILIEKELTHQSPNLMNLSRVSNPPKPALIERWLKSWNIEYTFKWNQP